MSDKLLKAKVQLILTEPFFATLMLSMKFIEDPTIETACTNGKEIRFNPTFVESLDIDRIKFLIAHEVLHCSLCHHTRQQEREASNWNRAADYAINPILKDSGFVMIESGLYDQAYLGMSAEEIYSKLPPEGKPQQKPGQGSGKGQQGQGNDPGGCGSVEQPSGATESDLKQAEAEMKQLVASAALSAKSQGKLPAHLQRLVDELLEPVINWKDVLSTFLTEMTRNDYSFSKPNKRYITQGLYLPTLESIEKGKFVLMVDTSGSIDKQQLNEFAGEIQGILAETANQITVMYIDTEVAPNVQEFETDDVLNLDPEGGGGTDFKPGFEYMDENGIEAKAVVYFTDGECDSFPPIPETPVLWALYGRKKDFNPPFGEVIKID